MTAGDVSACVDLVGRAMDPGEAEYARDTFRFHFESRERDMDDGRRIYVCETGGRLVGIVGLHFYVWGPRENVWLSWFAVDPDHQGSGLGRRMFEAAMEEAARLGYGKVLIETYASATFAKATRFYLSQGFCVAGTIADYMPDGSSMVVLSRAVRQAAHAAG